MLQDRLHSIKGLLVQRENIQISMVREKEKHAAILMRQKPSCVGEKAILSRSETEPCKTITLPRYVFFSKGENYFEGKKRKGRCLAMASA